MDYLLLFVATFCVGGQFALTKLYQTKLGTAIIPSLLFSLFSGLFSIVYFAVICGFNIEFNWFSFLMAGGRVLSIVLFTVLGFKMMSIGRVALYTMFIMLGGMVVTFFYGLIFLGEQLSVLKAVGIVLLLASLVIPEIKKKDGEKKNSKLFFLLGVLVFFANGAVGIFSKVHQISEYALPTEQFSFWSSVINAVAVAIMVLVVALLQKDKKVLVKEIKNAMPKWWIIVLFVLISQSGELFQLIAAKTLDATILFPIVSGGTMVVSAVFGFLFFKEKPDKLLVISLVVSLIATVLFVF